MARISRYELLSSSVGALVHILFVAIPKDLWRWRNLTPKDVRNKTIVITGAASGLGKAMAELFAIDYGAKVAIVDVNEISASCYTQLVACKSSNSGQVDIVICNAAILFFGHALQLTTAQLQKSFNVNIMGTVNTIRAFLRDMEERNDGQIVVISSIAGCFGETNGLAYCPSKFAVRGVMESIQMEMRDRGLNGIKFTTIYPYFVRTPMILKMGMRPTSSLTSNNVRMAIREYLNCRYEPMEKLELEKDQQCTLSKNIDFFKKLDLLWKCLAQAPLFAVTVTNLWFIIVSD
ncbi:unnamed protein product [Anisakis simplex]|uniref:Short-chain dehydrogenase/reductase family 16C member 6 n=1 Tax=Anisakis simplex TaxID=6269 RepID=A0A158PNZ6_ANISI|nr:unnamed protein product [Anisakis simplex]